MLIQYIIDKSKTRKLSDQFLTIVGVYINTMKTTRIHQYNEDDFYLKCFDYQQAFANYKFTSKKIEKLFIVYMLKIQIKIRIY